MQGIEALAARYQHTIAALGTLSTLAAVLVSLGLAVLSSRASRTRLKASASLTFIRHDTIPRASEPHYITVSVVNTGLLPLRLPFGFFFWRVPFQAEGWLVNAMDYVAEDPWVAKQEYPRQVQPRASLTVFLMTRETLVENIEQMHRQIGPAAWRLRFLNARVGTDDGRQARVKLSKELRELIRAVSRSCRQPPSAT